MSDITQQEVLGSELGRVKVKKGLTGSDLSSVFSLKTIQGMTGEYGLGRATITSKYLDPHHSHVKEIFVVKACWADMP